jgi:hypothetical protein
MMAWKQIGNTKQQFDSAETEALAALTNNDLFPVIEIRENTCVNGPIAARIFKFER